LFNINTVQSKLNFIFKEKLIQMGKNFWLFLNTFLFNRKIILIFVVGL
jgi:hypothetical protein